MPVSVRADFYHTEVENNAAYYSSIFLMIAQSALTIKGILNTRKIAQALTIIYNNYRQLAKLYRLIPRQIRQ